MEISLETVAVGLTALTMTCFFLWLAVWGVMDVIRHKKRPSTSKHECIDMHIAKRDFLEILTEVKNGTHYTISNNDEVVAELVPSSERRVC